ncbi:tetratricopeptide repeat protein [Paraburkholderia sp. GAS334]|uniref:tetratricopeptide repeat protein n=1 Tax=Paraburkholderia sp. GAS334 TaxID=3035131 RepID=UPI003D24141A
MDVKKSMLRKLVIAMTLGAVAVLGACGKKGDEYVGSWHEPGDRRTYTIARISGDTFEVTDSGVKNGNLPGHYQNGVLNVATALGNMELSYDKQNDSLKVNILGQSLGAMTRMGSEDSSRNNGQSSATAYTPEQASAGSNDARVSTAAADAQAAADSAAELAAQAAGSAAQTETSSAIVATQVSNSVARPVTAVIPPAPTAAAAIAPPPAASAVLPPAPNASTESAGLTGNCTTAVDCAKSMLVFAKSENLAGAMQAASIIDSLSKPHRGDRVTARKLNSDGLNALNASKPDDAVKLFAEANQSDPGDVEIISNLSYAYAADSQLTKSEDTAVLALAINPRRTSVWAPLAETIAKEDRPDQAVEAMWLAYQFSGDKQKTLDFISSRMSNERDPKVLNMYAASKAWFVENKRPDFH